MRTGQDIDYRAFVDAEKGLVDRKIFSDQEIYDMEMERIFARAWNFMCHETQVEKPGDFFLSFIGEESVIATRDKKGNLQVLLNTCRHRGNAVCRAEEGRATSFLCTYHGWTYDLEGRLVGVPGYKDFYHEALDREQWGLPKAAKVQSYKGFVFATMDPEAPELDAFLGPIGRMSLDLLAAQGPLTIVNGIQKSVIGCNWKLAVDNLFDYYHVQISHASAMMSGFRDRRDGRPAKPMDFSKHRVMLGDYGHAIGGPRISRETIDTMEANENPLRDETWRRRSEAQEILGPVGIEVVGHPNLFPNLWVTEANQLSLRLPKGPFATEIWWFTLAPVGLTPEQTLEAMRGANHQFGPAGMLEQEDGENWDQSTRAMRGPLARRYPLNFSMNLGRGEIVHDHGLSYIDTHINEHAQLWTYRSWVDWMSAETWADLEASRTRPPQTVA